MFEIGTRPGHPTTTDVVAYAGIGLGIALMAFAGHPTSTDVVARPNAYYQSVVVAAPGFPTQYAGLRIWDGVMKELCLVATADAPVGMGGQLRVRKGGTVYAVYLVETGDANSSTLRIRTVTGTKSVRLKT